MAIAGEILEQSVKAVGKTLTKRGTRKAATTVGKQAGKKIATTVGKKTTKAAAAKVAPAVAAPAAVPTGVPKIGPEISVKGIEEQIAEAMPRIQATKWGKELAPQQIEAIKRNFRKGQTMDLQPEIEDTIRLLDQPEMTDEATQFLDNTRGFADADIKAEQQIAARDATRGMEPEPPTEVDLRKKTMEDITSGNYKGKGGADKMRGLWGWLTGGTDAPKGYSDKGVLPRREGAKSVLHHAVGLRDFAVHIMAHPSWQRWRDGVNPLIQATEALGFKFGNHYENLTEVLDVMPDAFRQAKINAAEGQIAELTDGIQLNRKTLDDLFQESGVQPRQLDMDFKGVNEGLEKGQIETRHYELMRRQNPGLTVDQYMNTYKSPVTGRAYAEGSFGRKIRVFDPKNPKKLLAEFAPTTAAEWDGRYNKVFDILALNAETPVERAKWLNVKKKFKLSKRKIDPKLAIYGPDHKTIHNIIDKQMKADPNTAIGHLEELTKTQGYQYIDDELMAKKLVAAAREHETIAYNVLLNRYNKITQLFSEMHPDGLGPLNSTWDELGAEAQRKFLYDNITEIARKGGTGFTLTKEQALVPIGKVPEGFANVFGWKAQTAIEPGLGMPRASFDKLKARMADPSDPAGNYRSPGGDTINISDRD